MSDPGKTRLSNSELYLRVTAYLPTGTEESWNRKTSSKMVNDEYFVYINVT